VADFEAIVVGAGPAGAAAALTLARAGHSVCLLERGPFPGSKNMYGGVVYGRVLDTLVPRWWEEAPVQRWVTRRATVLMTPTQSLTVDVRVDGWGEPPYNGATALRPDFDSWLADKAVAAGATLVCSTTATGLLWEGDRVVGIRTDRPDGDLTAPVVVACDGVNSFLAKEAGLYRHTEASHFTLGAKEVLALPAHEIEQRFGLVGRQGADFEILGCTGDIPGGGFLYTNLDTVAVGVVLSVEGLAASAVRPEQVIARLKAHSLIAPLVAGAELKEYSAHLIPEGGYEMMPDLVADGLVVAGDAAATCLAAGIWLEGVNYAIGSGAAAGAAVASALAQGDTSAAGLASYRQRLEDGFVLANLRRLRRTPALLLSERMQLRYPQIVCNLAERLFTVDDPVPKPRMLRAARQELARAGVGLGHLARDGWAALRSFG
jgi:electron transfer flavoprotein-quinone oxidoreductase